MHKMMYGKPLQLLFFGPPEKKPTCREQNGQAASALRQTALYKRANSRRKNRLDGNKKGTSQEVPFKMVDRTGLEPVTSCV